jgi:hypothetical protein
MNGRRNRLNASGVQRPRRTRGLVRLAPLVAVPGVLLALLLAGSVVASQRPLEFVIGSTHGQPNSGMPQLWSGTIHRSRPHVGGVVECRSVGCDHIVLDVKLPSGLWQRHPGGVEVAIQFTRGTINDNLLLVVYHGNRRMGESSAAVGTAQSVVLRAPANGLYDVYVAAGIAYGSTAPSPSIGYQGLSQVVYDQRREPVRSLLPHLVALPQRNLGFSEPFEIFNDPVPHGSTCFHTEIVEQHAHLCLRFDQELANVGAGPLDLRFNRPAGITPVNGQKIPVRQRIYRSDGSHYDVPAGYVFWHAIHHHYHFAAFAQSDLWAVDVHGNRTGSKPVASGLKVSFCIATTDIDPAWWGRRGFGPDSYPAPACVAPQSRSHGLDHFKLGMSAGWADVYNWFLPGQFIDVSGVPDGSYLLDTTVDPLHRLIVSSRSGSCGSVRVRLSGMATAHPRARLLGIGPSCNGY